jgi:hypothetical protein
LAGFILLDDLHDGTAAYQYLARALELGLKSETKAEVHRMLAAIELQQKLQIGNLRGRNR